LGTVAALTMSLMELRAEPQTVGQGRGQGQQQAQPQGRGTGAQTTAPPGGARSRDWMSGDIVNSPAPRLADGHPDLTGPWLGGGSDADIEREGGLKPGELISLMQPWARELRAQREKAIYGEPYIYCLPMSVPRINPYPWKFVMGYTSKGLQYVYQLHETGDAGAHRVIYMDGRPHPNPNTLIATWWGHSIGRWEGDTLVIDTVGYNDKFWFDAPGTPHSEKLHTIERWTRISYGTLVNDFTLEDPDTFSKPVQLRFVARIVKPGVELMEYICAENNQIGLAGGYLGKSDASQIGIGGGPVLKDEKK
jgi:hypothetical protein